jgi:hypothetical protein
MMHHGSSVVAWLGVVPPTRAALARAAAKTAEKANFMLTTFTFMISNFCVAPGACLLDFSRQTTSEQSLQHHYLFKE